MISVVVPVSLRMARPPSESRAASERGAPDTYVSSIDVNDGGAAGALAAPAGVYNVVDDEP
jgi:hypothetical protein